MVIKIGREVSGEFDILVPSHYETVSRFHAELKEEQGQLVLIDYSTNGTFVNQRRIKRKQIQPTDEIYLGHLTDGFSLNTKKLIQIFQKQEQQTKTDFSEEFLQLKPVYEAYERERDSLMKTIKIKSIAPRLIITILGIVAILLLNISPELKIAFSMGIGLVAMLVSSLFVKDSANKKSIENLVIQYNRKYVCPKCQNKLTIQSRSWNMLYEDGKCPYSKCDATYKNQFMN